MRTSRLVLTRVGSADGTGVELEEHDDAAPGPDDVLVEVDAAPINPADQLFMRGRFGVYPRVPHPLGAEGAGRVLRAGAAVDPSMAGRQVVILPTFRHGAWADRVVVPATDVVVIDRPIDPVQLAMLAVGPATAHALLTDYAELKPGDWVGVGLAGSSVGRHVIALAQQARIKTLAIVRSAEAADEVHVLGADEVVVEGAGIGDRMAEALEGRRLRLLFDGGSPALAELLTALEDGGTVVTYGSVHGQPVTIPVQDLIYRRLTLCSFYIVDWVRRTPRDELRRLYADLADLVAAGILSTPVEATYPLDRFAEALGHAGRPERAGKVLFVSQAAAG